MWGCRRPQVCHNEDCNRRLVGRDRRCCRPFQANLPLPLPLPPILSSPTPPYPRNPKAHRSQNAQNATLGLFSSKYIRNAIARNYNLMLHDNVFLYSIFLTHDLQQSCIWYRNPLKVSMFTCNALVPHQFANSVLLNSPNINTTSFSNSSLGQPHISSASSCQLRPLTAFSRAASHSPS